MFRILDRYVLLQIVPLYVLAIAGFTLFSIIFDAFERIDVFVDHKTPVGLILQYYVAGSAFTSVLVSPIALLLAVFIVLGQMTRFHEITAMKTAGLSLYRILAPVFLFALLVSWGAWWMAESVMPGANLLKKQIYNEQIRGRQPRSHGIRVNLNYLGPGGRVWAVRRLDVRRQELLEVVVQEFGPAGLERRVDARQGAWRDSAWVFYDGVLRRFDGEIESAAPFDSLRMPEFRETTEDLARDEAEPAQMTGQELGTFIERLGQSGRPTFKYETERHLKVAFPLVNLMVVLLAGPLATRLRKGGIAIGFGLSFLLFVTYVGLVRFGQILGHNGEIPPWPAAWLGNIVFGLAGAWFLLRTPK